MRHQKPLHTSALFFASTMHSHYAPSTIISSSRYTDAHAHGSRPFNQFDNEFTIVIHHNNNAIRLANILSKATFHKCPWHLTCLVVLRSSSVIPKATFSKCYPHSACIVLTLPTAQSRRQGSSESYAESQGIGANVQESWKLGSLGNA